jgi:ABC-2 type transport system ATP-binding protein
MADAAVVAHDLVRRFGDFTAVDRVSFEIPAGEVFGFLGPNGAGKTTTLKMLSGLLRPSQGSARVAGLDVAREADAVRRRIGYMSQRFSLYTDLSVEENLELFSALYGVTGARRRERQDWVLEMAGLTDQRRRLTGELPLGWRQRLALGSAVLHEPAVLFLDEPTSGVDPRTRRSFWDLIYSLGEGGTTVLVSTHYMEEAEYCHRLALMNRGRLIALDTAGGLRRSMRDPILEIRADDPVHAVAALRETHLASDVALHGRNVRVVVSGSAPGAADAAESAIRSALGEVGIGVVAVRGVDPTLDDVFAFLVRREGGVAAG